METAAKVLLAQGIQIKMARGFVSTPMISLAANQMGCEIGIIYPEGCEGEVMPYEKAINQFRVYAMMREKVRLWTARGLWRE